MRLALADARPRTVSLWLSVPQRLTVPAAGRVDDLGNRARSAPGTLVGQRGRQTPRLAGCRPRLPDQKASTAARALPTGRDSSGFRNVRYPRANASRECYIDQPRPTGQRRVALRIASALESVHRSQDMDNRCALLAWGKASRPPAIQNLTARTSVAACEP